MRRLADWLEQTDYGYGFGLLLYTLAAVVALWLGTLWPLTLWIPAFALCWWFG